MGAVARQTQHVFKCIGLWVAFCVDCRKSNIRDTWEEAFEDADDHVHGCKKRVPEVPC